MARAELNGAAIIDWPSFHAASKATFGFPDFYGNNISAWIDCLSYLRDDDAMSCFRLAPNELLTIQLLHATNLRQRVPEILAELEFCIAAVNERYADYGEKPALQLLLIE
ncbi:MAG: barstar family protein [Herbaspirillum sp.]